MPVVMCIDIGVIHLGWCIADVSDDFQNVEILFVDLVDITIHHPHFSPLKQSECGMYHARQFADWVAHFVENHRMFFDAADLILIEKQPPQGFVVVEQLLYAQFRHKTQLLNPRTVQAYFGISHLDYEARKRCVEKIADRELPPHLVEQTHLYERRHDIADSICLLLYYRRRKSDEWKREQRRRYLLNTSIPGFAGMSAEEKLECFRYV